MSGQQSEITYCTMHMVSEMMLMSQDQINLIMSRLDKLFHDLPFEYAGYVLTAIEDIEDILYKKEQE